ncbi:hypothetical protein BDW75DRAFT_222384 [Aspergillus navahoensis]
MVIIFIRGKVDALISAEFSRNYLSAAFHVQHEDSDQGVAQGFLDNGMVNLVTRIRLLIGFSYQAIVKSATAGSQELAKGIGGAIGRASSCEVRGTPGISLRVILIVGELQLPPCRKLSLRHSNCLVTRLRVMPHECTASNAGWGDSCIIQKRVI